MHPSAANLPWVVLHFDLDGMSEMGTYVPYLYRRRKFMSHLTPPPAQAIPDKFRATVIGSLPWIGVHAMITPSRMHQ